jgi:hypothetical protein
MNDNINIDSIIIWWSVFMFNCLRSDIVVRFVDIGVIVHPDCLISLLIKKKGEK